MTDFYEDDEPVGELLAAFDAATEKGKTMRPRRDPLAKALAAIEKIPDERQREVVKREFAQAYKDDPRLWGDAVPAEPVQPRRLTSLVSVRLPANLAADLRERANNLGISLSDLLRHAADEFLRPTGWQCAHMSIGSGGVVRLENVTCNYGCTMRPAAYTTTR